MTAGIRERPTGMQTLSQHKPHHDDWARIETRTPRWEAWEWPTEPRQGHFKHAGNETHLKYRSYLTENTFCLEILRSCSCLDEDASTVSWWSILKMRGSKLLRNVGNYQWLTFQFKTSFLGTSLNTFVSILHIYEERLISDVL
jgi:hypothetical protein